MTNKRVQFLSPAGNKSVDISAIDVVDRYSDGIGITPKHGRAQFFTGVEPLFAADLILSAAALHWLAPRMADRYIVSVQAEYDTDWYLSPMAFASYDAAMAHAVGIAKSWVGAKGEPPFISITDDDGRNDLWTWFGLLSAHYILLNPELDGLT